MTVGDSPDKGSDVYVWAGLSTDTKPPKAFIGDQLIETDSGLVSEWTGSEWTKRIGGVQIDSLVKSMPTTSTFHHLGHEGKVFIHSANHAGVLDTTWFDTLIRIPASPTTRQVHMRWAYTLSGATPGTAVEGDLVLYKDVVTSADGTAESIVSNNDVNIKTSGVEVFHTPTVTDVGSIRTYSKIVAAKGSSGTADLLIPEYIMAPGTDYLLRLTNLSGGTVSLVNAVFFYDSEAA